MTVTIKAISVTELNVWLDKKLPPTLHAEVRGIFSSPACTNARLSPWVYIQPPADGIWDFSLIADQRDGYWPQITVELTATLAIELPKGCVGIRVHASTNEMQYGGPSDGAGLDPRDMATQGGVDAFPWKARSLSSGVGDPFPWMLPIAPPVPMQRSNDLLGQPVSSLLGKRVRKILDGNFYTGDYVKDRVNIVFSADGLTIKNIWMG
jgi:hypothetical protein